MQICHTLIVKSLRFLRGSGDRIVYLADPIAQGNRALKNLAWDPAYSFAVIVFVLGRAAHRQDQANAGQDQAWEHSRFHLATSNEGKISTGRVCRRRLRAIDGRHYILN
jgi:hypothetical protein